MATGAGVFCNVSRRRLVLALALLILNFALFAGHGQAREGGACVQHPGDVEASGSLAAGRGEFLLDEHQTSRLAWLDTPADFLAARHAGLETLLAQEPATEVSVHVRTGGVLDRWGTPGIIADVGLSSGDCINVQEWLLRQGLARLRPERENEPAPAELVVWRQAERDAETARRGVWRAGDHMVLDASSADVIRGHEGRFVVVEGFVQSVNERPGVTYLNFGSRWTEDMTVSAPARIWRMLTRGGLTAARLQDGKIRVRGIVETRGGPLIELTSPADLEVARTGNLP